MLDSRAEGVSSQLDYFVDSIIPNLQRRQFLQCVDSIAPFTFCYVGDLLLCRESLIADIVVGVGRGKGNERRDFVCLRRLR